MGCRLGRAPPADGGGAVFACPGCHGALVVQAHGISEAVSHICITCFDISLLLPLAVFCFSEQLNSAGLTGCIGIMTCFVGLNIEAYRSALTASTLPLPLRLRALPSLSLFPVLLALI